MTRAQTSSDAGGTGIVEEEDCQAVHLLLVEEQQVWPFHCGQVQGPVLADLLGVHINTATRWAELAGRHHAGYLSLRGGGWW